MTPCLNYMQDQGGCAVLRNGKTWEITLYFPKPGDFGGNAHRVQGDIWCKVLAAFSTVK